MVRHLLTPRSDIFKRRGRTIVVSDLKAPTYQDHPQ